MSQVPEEGSGDDRETVGSQLRNLEALQALDSHLSHISAERQSAIKMLLVEFSPLFKDIPGQTTLAVHDVDVDGSSPIKQHPYRLPPSKLHVLKEELSYMLETGDIERGQSEWSSLMVLVPKPGQTFRPCIEYSKVNQVTRADAFSIPWLEDCIDRICICIDRICRATVVSK